MWNTLCMGPNKAPKKLCNFIFSKILITRVFEKQTKKILIFRRRRPFTGSRKVVEKMPDQKTYGFKNDLQLHGCNSDEINGLIQRVQVAPYYIGMSFGIEKCLMLAMKRQKELLYKGIDLSEQSVIQSADEGCKYLGILEKGRVSQDVKHVNVK